MALTHQHIDLAILAIRNYRGDNLERARAAFRGLSPQQMQAMHGESGITRAELLASYEEHARACEAAIEALRNERPAP